MNRRLEVSTIRVSGWVIRSIYHDACVFKPSPNGDGTDFISYVAVLPQPSAVSLWLTG